MVYIEYYYMHYKGTILSFRLIQEIDLYDLN